MTRLLSAFEEDTSGAMIIGRNMWLERAASASASDSLTANGGA